MPKNLENTKTRIPVYRDFDHGREPEHFFTISPKKTAIEIEISPPIESDCFKSMIGTAAVKIIEREDLGENYFIKKAEIMDWGLQPGYADYRDDSSQIRREYADAERKLRYHNEAVLEQIRNLRGNEFYSSVRGYIEQGDGFIIFNLSNGKAGDRQEVISEGDLIKYEWVNQSCGPCGDDYYGDVYIHVIAGIYLKIYFQC